VAFRLRYISKTTGTQNPAIREFMTTVCLEIFIHLLGSSPKWMRRSEGIEAVESKESRKRRILNEVIPQQAGEY
jgi:hypothetical protein